MKINVGNDQLLEWDSIESMLPKDPETNAVKGSFDFKPDTVIRMKSGEVVKTPTPVADLIKAHEEAVERVQSQSPLPKSSEVVSDDFLKALDAVIAELQIIRKEFGFLREVLTRFCIVIEKDGIQTKPYIQ